MFQIAMWERLPKRINYKKVFEMINKNDWLLYNLPSPLSIDIMNWFNLILRLTHQEYTLIANLLTP